MLQKMEDNTPGGHRLLWYHFTSGESEYYAAHCNGPDGLILMVRLDLFGIETWKATDSDGRYSSVSSSLGIAKSKIENWAIEHNHHNPEGKVGFLTKVLVTDDAPAQELDRDHTRKFAWNICRSQTIGSIVLGGLDVFVQEEVKPYLDSLDDNSSRMSTANKMKHASNLFSCISREMLEFSKSLDKVYDSIKGDL